MNGDDENDRFWVDQCSGATISPMVRSVRWGFEMVRSNGFSGFDEWVFSIRRSAIKWVRRSRSRFLGSRFLFFLSLCASELFLSLALSLFCAWLGNGLKVKWNCKTISESNEQNFGQTEIIFRKFYFP